MGMNTVATIIIAYSLGVYVTRYPSEGFLHGFVRGMIAGLLIMLANIWL